MLTKQLGPNFEMFQKATRTLVIIQKSTMGHSLELKIEAIRTKNVLVQNTWLSYGTIIPRTLNYQDMKALSIKNSPKTFNQNDKPWMTTGLNSHLSRIMLILEYEINRRNVHFDP